MASNASIIARLGAPEVVEPLDFESIWQEIRDDMVTRFPTCSPYIDLMTEPLRYLFEVVAYRELNIRARINDASKESNSFWFATGTTLDLHAENRGVERLAGETDDTLRTRISLAVNGVSKAGTAQYYEFLALSTNPEVARVKAYRNGTGPVVNVAIFSAISGGVPSQALLNEVSSNLNAPENKMVSDTINVIAAVVTTVDVVANVWVHPDFSQDLLPQLREDLVLDWDGESAIGFDLTKSWLISRLMKQGVYRVDIVTPSADVVVSEFDAISIGTVTLNYMGQAY